jgi:hypothetical protein
MSTLERAFDSGGAQAVEERARDLGMATEVRRPAVPADGSVDIPPSVWVYDRDLPADDQLLGTVGGLATNTTCR